MAVFTNFHEIQFPPYLSWGVKGGPNYSTSLQSHKSGHEGRVSEWSVARGYWECSHTIKNDADFAELLAFFRVRRGRFYGFRFKDWFDYQANVDGVTPQVLGDGDGVTTTFQLIKTYEDAEGSEVRTIHKPVNNGTLEMYLNGVLVSGANYTVDYTTGIVTFTSGAPSGGVEVSSYYEFDVPVRFGTDKLEGSYEQFNNKNWQGIPVVELRPR